MFLRATNQHHLAQPHGLARRQGTQVDALGDQVVPYDERLDTEDAQYLGCHGGNLTPWHEAAFVKRFARMVACEAFAGYYLYGRAGYMLARRRRLDQQRGTSRGFIAQASEGCQVILDLRAAHLSVSAAIL